MKIAKAIYVLLTVMLCVTATSQTLTAGMPATPLDRSSQGPAVERNANEFSKSPQAYQGYLRIYIVEPVSRYLDFTHRNYQFGFLGFAINQSISINDGEMLCDTLTWNAGTFAPISENNIMAIAVVFNSEGHQAYSDPSTQGYPFTAHWVDAAASSVPGEIAIDDPIAPYTHTVFVEEATRSGCTYCPATRAALEAIYSGGQYQFLYAAMITDNTAAASYLFGTYNTGYTPTCYFDGGHGVYVGGSSSQTTYTSRIVATSDRPVSPVKIAVKLNFVSSTQLAVEYIVKPNNQAPETPAAPSGETLVRAGSISSFTVSCVDSDNDALYYQWKYDKDDSTDWLGPHASGENCQMEFSWPTGGLYEITVKSKDLWAESAGSSTALEVLVYTCGDADANSIVTISDAVYLINFIFAGGPGPTPTLAGDADCNAIITISDAVYLINFIFAGGPAPCQSCP